MLEALDATWCVMESIALEHLHVYANVNAKLEGFFVDKWEYANHDHHTILLLWGKGWGILRKIYNMMSFR